MMNINVIKIGGVFLGIIFATPSQTERSIIRMYGTSQARVLSVQYTLVSTEQEPSCFIPKQTSL
jgi:hypothetical protein